MPEPLDRARHVPSYDPRAPVAGRKRAVVVVGGAGVVALMVAGVLLRSGAAAGAPPASPAPAARSRRAISTKRAEAALAANELGEALELAHLALVADPRFADAHFVVANVRAGAQPGRRAARDAYRKYLELAPLGTHAAEARAALAALPP